MSDDNINITTVQQAQTNIVTHTLFFSLLSEPFFKDLWLAADGFDLWLASDQPCPLIAIADTVDEVDG